METSKPLSSRKVTTVRTTIVVAAASLFSVAILGCGGGGGGDDTTDFTGVWSGNASLVDDTCGVITPDQQFIFFTHLVNQNQNQVALDNGFLSFSGTVQNEKAFLVETEKARAAVPGTTDCTEKVSFRYDAVTNNEAQFVVRSSTVNCTADSGEAFECKFAFTGSAFRATVSGSGGRPFPLPVEGDTRAGGPIFLDDGAEVPTSVDSTAADESTL